ncbi:MAG: putative toxin-antitoxin system toxin component, PIN family [Succinimonas sp.]|nr:putative toxin-antitoxin system toxin component, PIN family [Succinimonas sp.]
MKYYAVIDTNVIVSAVLKQDSVPGKVVRMALEGSIVPILNDVIENEYREVLSRPKFHLSQSIIEDIIFAFRDKGLYVEAGSFEIELPDPKDRVFYEVVMEKRKSEETWLVTGNIRHFPVEPFIVTPREMLDVVLNDGDA